MNVLESSRSDAAERRLSLPALLFHNPTDGSLASVGLLVVRCIAGPAMMLHGATKILKPMTWMGEGVPGVLQLLAAVAEFGGGVAWTFGVLTPVASLGVLITMVVGIAIAHVPSGDPLIRLTVTGDPSGSGAPWGGLPGWLVKADGRGAPGSGSSELALLFSAFAVLLATLGAGRYSLDRLLARVR